MENFLHYLIALRRASSSSSLDFAMAKVMEQVLSKFCCTMRACMLRPVFITSFIFSYAKENSSWPSMSRSVVWAWAIASAAAAR